MEKTLKELNIIKGYHYTTRFEDKIKTEGLIPKTGFIMDVIPEDFSLFLDRAEISMDARNFLNLPQEAYKLVTKCLLELEPGSWKNNPLYPDLWSRLMFGVFNYSPRLDWPCSGICSKQKLTLLEIDLTPEDIAYVSEENFVRQIHHFKLPIDKEGFNKDNKKDLRKRAEQIKHNIRRYWESRISLFNYKGNYMLPVLTIENRIPSDRLKIHSVRFAKDIEEISPYLV